MSISMLLEMAVAGDAERVAVVEDETRLTTAQLAELAAGGSGAVAAADPRHLVYVGTGGVALPLLMFSAAAAGRPFSPLNYRLSADSLCELVERLPRPLVVADDDYLGALAGVDAAVVSTGSFIERARAAVPAAAHAAPDDVAIVLFTSGTTSRPKAVELTHANLTAYITGTIEFASATAGDAALVCVPPYHIAGVGAALSNLYAGRRIVYLRAFDARAWIELVNREHVTTATVVPTMLDRIVSAIEAQGARMPTLRNLAYGGSKVPLPLVRKALDLLPDVGFVNAYGLTETSSTIAVLGPDDHRAARAASDGPVARRLGSVGRPIPGIELQIRAEDGNRLGPGETGELFVRGEQVSGRYSESGSVLDSQGWFPTKDLASLDSGGYLYIAGRSDDTIIRGGENIAPAELEEVLVEHPGVREVAVVGLDDAQWGQIIVAVVVPDSAHAPGVEELRDHVRGALRGSRTPDRVVFRDELPVTATGKVLRRQLVAELNPTV